MAYKVKVGDTLQSIAKRLGTTAAELAKANGLSSSNRLTVGGTLNVPTESKTQTQSQQTTAPEVPKAVQSSVQSLVQSNTQPQQTQTLSGNSNYAYQPYTPSAQVQQAQRMLEQQLANKPGAYQSRWDQTLDEIYNQIQNKKDFSYDLNGDALYQQYKNQYINQGKLAMMDTIGQAAALTGGYGNSYAQSVGQQTYQGYLNQLNDKIPELYQLALDQYNRQSDEMMNRYALVSDREAKDYARYQDAMQAWQSDRNYLMDAYNNERSFDYGVYGDNRNFNYQINRDAVADAQWQKNYDYQVGRDAVADAQWQSQFDEARRQYEQDFNESQRQYNQNFDYQQSRDTIADQQWQQQFDEARRQYEQEYDYQRERDAMADTQWASEYNYRLDRDTVEDQQWQAAFDYEKGRDTVADQQWQAEFEEAKRQYDLNYGLSASKASGSSGGSGGGGNPTGDTTKYYKNASGTSFKESDIDSACASFYKSNSSATLDSTTVENFLKSKGYTGDAATYAKAVLQSYGMTVSRGSSGTSGGGTKKTMMTR